MEDKKKQQAKNVGIGCLVTIIVIFLFIILFVVMCDSDNSSKEEKSKFTKLDAVIHSQLYVEKNLLSPKGAEFPFYSDDEDMNELDILIKMIDDTTYLIHSYVDAPNVYGTMLRKKYTCVITYSPSLEGIRYSDLKLEE